MADNFHSGDAGKRLEIALRPNRDAPVAQNF
jgi:hypothetical protein